ncbi:MAG: penicillin acylase family protein [Bacteroidota bacterium]|nr:penicillin acylase family protein [Bacteroidota bacterium]
MKKMILILLFPLQLTAQHFTGKDIQRCENEAKYVTIIRDNWGIPHIYGKTDADAVFGLMYAQCEDDFNRVEMNYIEKLGRLAEVNGSKDIYNDLLTRLVIDSADAVKDYQNSPLWLHRLLDAFADGINFYLYKHPETHPALLHHFKPWYPLLWTDGSIGAISTAGLTDKDLENLYGNPLSTSQKDIKTTKTGTLSFSREENPTGSNGFAFAPSITQNHHAILYINPHVTFYFRPEVHMISEEGLNTYGAVTWGQFFVYQGFNEHCGWMHTSSQVDVSDAYIERIKNLNGRWIYEYEHTQKPVTEKNITIHYKENNRLLEKGFTTLFTHHGPVMARKNGQWLSVRSFNRSIISLEQSWLRTKANSFAAFKKVLDMRGNTSNNTVYADAEGNIAYWHGNYVPVRDKQFDWNKPVDGTITATEWKGLHTTNEIVHVINPANGWIQNCNSTPFSVTGITSPKKESYPAYMAPDGENFRGVNAVRILDKEKNYTLDKVINTGYDTYLAFFEKLIPALLKAYDQSSGYDSFATLKAPIEVMRQWNLHSGESSVATTLAVTWGMQLRNIISLSTLVDDKGYDIVTRINSFAGNSSNGHALLEQFSKAVNDLISRYGTWNKEWGEINRFQRISNTVDPSFDDQQPSIPVGFTSSQWGQIPSYTSRTYPNTRKLYGVNGNSFICAVEFGKRITAKSLLAGGESGHIDSKHFTDQALMYSKGLLKPVCFYKEDVLQHAERTYHPGE